MDLGETFHTFGTEHCIYSTERNCTEEHFKRSKKNFTNLIIVQIINLI